MQRDFRDSRYPNDLYGILLSNSGNCRDIIPALLKGKFFVCNDVSLGFQLTGRYNKKRLF